MNNADVSGMAVYGIDGEIIAVHFPMPAASDQPQRCEVGDPVMHEVPSQLEAATQEQSPIERVLTFTHHLPVTIHRYGGCGHAGGGVRSE